MKLKRITDEFERLGATDATAQLDDEFEPKAGELVKIELQGAYWHLLPQRLLELLKDLPDGAGSDAIRVSIERNATHVWHGPAPKGSRDRDSGV